VTMLLPDDISFELFKLAGELPPLHLLLYHLRVLVYFLLVDLLLLLGNDADELLRALPRPHEAAQVERAHCTLVLSQVAGIMEAATVRLIRRGINYLPFRMLSFTDG
jgi:hypothetical protein